MRYLVDRSLGDAWLSVELWTVFSWDLRRGPGWIELDLGFIRITLEW